MRFAAVFTLLLVYPEISIGCCSKKSQLTHRLWDVDVYAAPTFGDDERLYFVFGQLNKLTSGS